MSRSRKIVIMYPSNKGGVEEVCLSLKLGFENLGYLVIFKTTYLSALLYSLKNIFSPAKDILITNLHYGFFGLFFKQSIFIIHGYPYYRLLGFFKYYKLLFFHFLFGKFNTKSVAVSYLIRYVCENHMGVKINKVIQNPLPADFHIPENIVAEPNTLIYIGRIFPTKGIDKILDAVNLCRNKYAQKIVFHIVGDGILFEEFKVKYQHPDNIFHGYVNAAIKYELLSKAEAFISLNEGEPFGLTALEAACFHKKCILPTYGGHTEFMPQSLLYTINDIYNIEEISLKMCSALNNTLNNEAMNNKINLENYKPENVADNYLQLFSNC